MQKLLSLPENLVASFRSITGYNSEKWFVTSDPDGLKIGSGAGAIHLLHEHKKITAKALSFEQYITAEKRIIIHAGGQSRRLPSYAPSGKVLAPLPVFRWSRGQRIDQCLLDLQMPLLEKMMEISGPEQNVLIAAGDVLVMTNELPFELPDADIVCLGIWADPHIASRHGVFFTSRITPHRLNFMLQKPSHKKIEQLSASHLFLMDAGIWILSNRAISVLRRKCRGFDKTDESPEYYDLYSAFGTCLGDHPSEDDPEICNLTSAVVPLHDGEFYHYGTSSELISSTEKIQNKVQDQRNIWHMHIKPHPSIFVQNALSDISWGSDHHHIWIENSHIPSSWQLSSKHVLTGIPGNDWEISVGEGSCIDVIPVDASDYCIRVYGIDDAFRGNIQDKSTLWIGKPAVDWFERRSLDLKESGITGDEDIQSAPLFPVTSDLMSAGKLIKWMIEPNDDREMRMLWLCSKRLSADEICSRANLKRLFTQREQFRHQNLEKIAMNYKHSIFYQSDLKHTALQFAKAGIPVNNLPAESEPSLIRCRHHMFRSELMKIKGLVDEAAGEERHAFQILQESLTTMASKNLNPKINVFPDQIIWGRSPARLDLAGGWSDTPPYCMQSGGSVLNIAVELNGQPPVQVFIRLCPEFKITIRSIDNGISEELTTFDDIRNFQSVGSVFAIPKAALYLAGFHPDLCREQYHSLQEQLAEFGGGFEISLLAAIPKGSGLGTSSILAATILGVISDFCSINWDRRTICHQTLILEQLLTTGGGWQDQYGGVFPGVKLLQSQPGSQDEISIRWMPDTLFTQPEYKNNWLLYYTGITRIAKSILSEIVRGMFLNETNTLRIVNEIKQHAGTLSDVIQRSDYSMTGKMIAHSWKLNKALDSGTNTPEIQTIIDMIGDYCLGLKLPGAGGGGYMVIAAKDAEASQRIQTLLTLHPPNNKARFVKMDLSKNGFQVSRS